MTSRFLLNFFDLGGKKSNTKYMNETKRTKENPFYQDLLEYFADFAAFVLFFLVI